jgi:hypothetical protein
MKILEQANVEHKQRPENAGANEKPKHARASKFQAALVQVNRKPATAWTCWTSMVQMKQKQGKDMKKLTIFGADENENLQMP